MNKFKQVVVVSVLALLSLNAMALPTITGKIDMGGGAYLLDPSGARVSDASSAVAIDFLGNQFRALSGEGDFAGAAGHIGGIQDLVFDPFNGPVTAFWTLGDFSFELTDVTRTVTTNSANFLVLNGTGVISAAGFDDTISNWSFSADSTGNGAFSWNAVSNVQSKPVPEPAILGLLALGLIGFSLRKIK